MVADAISNPSVSAIDLVVQPGDMGDDLVPNGLSVGCKDFCSRSKYPRSQCVKLTSQVPSSSSLMPSFSPARTVDLTGIYLPFRHHKSVEIKLRKRSTAILVSGRDATGRKLHD